jgi:UDP-N-acetylmuramoyl-tripeptide--D-alanyl-D-alanine ligase
MWEALRPDGTLVLNAEDPLLLSSEEGIKQKIVWFGLHPKSMLKVRRIESQELGSSCVINDAFEMLLSVPGRHNLMNALAAITCAAVMGHDIERAARRMESFTGVPGRLNVVHAEGSLLIDDSYNSNPTSLRAALEVLRDANTEGRRIAVIGDMLELGSRAEELHAEAGRWVVEAKADLLVAVGPLSRFLAEGAKSAGLPEDAIKTFNDSEKAKDFVSELIKPGDTLLLKGSRGMQMERIAACFTTSSIR